MSNYYSKQLNSSKLQKCYEVAPARIKQFLEAEIKFVLDKINPNDKVLDLGCGYGRVAIKLLKKTNNVIGIDISKENIKLAKEITSNQKTAQFYEMNAIDLKLICNLLFLIFPELLLII